MHHHNDQRYIDALMHNNMQVLEELYKKFSGKIKWMVMQNNGSEDDAGDIFQDALLCIYRQATARNFILTCPFEAFLYTICKKNWLKELMKRKHGGVTIHDDKEYMIDGESLQLIEETELMQARHNLFTRKLGELSETCRRLLQMNWNGKSMEEVAAALHMSYGYARKKKSQCMAKLVMLIKQSSSYKSLKW